MKIIHIADIHATNKEEKQNDIERCGAFAVDYVKENKPDLIVLAGDTVDEYDGRINIDSRAGRWIVGFVMEMAMHAPVAIVRGTISHDRGTPDLFEHLESLHPIHVSNKMEIVSLIDTNDGTDFRVGIMPETYETKAVLTFLPSPNKAHVVVNMDGQSIQATNMIASEMLHDAMVALGGVVDHIPDRIPKITVGHGMITGSEMSGGFEMVGDDFEFSINDLSKIGSGYTAFGHVHKAQEFAGNIHYSGSLARLDFGEKEDKGFKVVTMNGNTVESVEFVKTPARRFEFFEYGWESGVEGFHDAFEAFCNGPVADAHVRVRIRVPEEDRHYIDRDMIVEKLGDLLGALEVKVEIAIIPKVRQRAEGISQMDDLAAKVQKWGNVVDIEVPESVIDIAKRIEGESLEELTASAREQLTV